jgi:hypothetical protein
MSRSTQFAGTADLPQTVCPSLKRRLTLDITARVTQGRVVDQHSRAFVGTDTSKLRNAVAVAEDGRGGDVRYLGEIDTMEAATRKLVTRLAQPLGQVCKRAERHSRF